MRENQINRCSHLAHAARNILRWDGAAPASMAAQAWGLAEATRGKSSAGSSTVDEYGGAILDIDWSDK